MLFLSVIINTSIRKNDKAMDILYIRNMDGTPRFQNFGYFFSLYYVGTPDLQTKSAK